MKKIVYISAILALCCFIMSGIFKTLHLMGAPQLLLSSGVFACLFVISFAIQRFTKK